MKPLNDIEFNTIVNFVRNRYGINLENKKTLIESRLLFDIGRRGYSSFSEYLSHIMSYPDGEECHHMLNRLSTNYTFFFREPSYIDYIEKNLLPTLCKGGKTIQIWCAGCSSGEEVFSVAAVLEHYSVKKGLKINYRILATDIDTDLLSYASEGTYHIEQEMTIPVMYRFIHRSGKTFKFDDSIRKKIEWRYENLLESNYENVFDIIFCRNVMIYFKSDLREKLKQKFYNALKPDGCLFLSATESFDLKTKIFVHEKPSAYRKR